MSIYYDRGLQLCFLLTFYSVYLFLGKKKKKKDIKIVKSKQIYEQNYFTLIVGGKPRQDKKVQACHTKIMYKCQQAKWPHFFFFFFFLWSIKLMHSSSQKAGQSGILLHPTQLHFGFEQWELRAPSHCLVCSAGSSAHFWLVTAQVTCSGLTGSAIKLSLLILTQLNPVCACLSIWTFSRQAAVFQLNEMCKKDKV